MFQQSLAEEGFEKCRKPSRCERFSKVASKILRSIYVAVTRCSARAGAAPRVHDLTTKKAHRHGGLSEGERRRNRGETTLKRPLLIAKQVFGLSKTRYWGLDKDADRAFVACGLAPLYHPEGDFWYRRRTRRFLAGHGGVKSADISGVERKGIGLSSITRRLVLRLAHEPGATVSEPIDQTRLRYCEESII